MTTLDQPVYSRLDLEIPASRGARRFIQLHNNKWPFEGLLKEIKEKKISSSSAKKEDNRQAAKSSKKDKKPKKDDSDDSDSKEEKGDDHRLPFEYVSRFGDLESAERLTNSSKKETDKMVDQLEKAQVAEEKRAVFRSLTHLRGVTISSFDGVAQAHTSNIDRYNKEHKWRKEHPVKHLASEEGNVEKWAFPKNADLLQKKAK